MVVRWEGGFCALKNFHADQKWVVRKRTERSSKALPCRRPASLHFTSLLTGKKCGIRAPFVARSLRFVGKKTPGGAGTHTGHTGHTGARGHTDHTDEPHNHPVGTPHRSFWMVCSSGHDRLAVTNEIAFGRNALQTCPKLRKRASDECRPSRSLRRPGFCNTCPCTVLLCSSSV